MKRIKSSKGLTFLGVAVLSATLSFAQDAGDAAKKAKPDEAAMMAAMMELSKPGANHKMLEGMVGSWTYKVKFWMSPDPAAPPSESSGTTSTKSTMGGRYFISEHTGNMQMPGPDGKMLDTEFHGMAIEGYDNVKKKYVSSWIDNMGTGIVMSEGTFDAAARTLTYLSEYEAMPGMKIKVRQTVTITDKNHRTMKFFEDRGGKEVKTMEISYTRSV